MIRQFKFNFSLREDGVGEFVAKLFEISVNSHIAHLQTSSHAGHEALNDLYKGLPDLIDRFVESYQGKVEVIKDYGSIQSINNIDLVRYLWTSVSEIEKFKSELADESLSAILDEALELLNTTVYKLRFLE